MCFGWLILECVFNASYTDVVKRSGRGNPMGIPVYGWLASLGVMVGDGGVRID